MGRIKQLKIDKNVVEEINSITKNDKRYRVRNRANAILLKSQLMTVSNIAKLLKVRAEQVYKWIQKFELLGIESFYDKPGRGRKTLLKNVDPESIRELVINLPSVAVANAIIKEKLNIHVHNETFRCYLKKTQINLHKSKEDTTKKA
jgi:transposase